MCFKPKVKEPPPPPNKLDSMNDALRNQAARRAGGITRGDTDVTNGLGGNPNVFTPQGGGRKVLGG